MPQQWPQATETQLYVNYKHTTLTFELYISRTWIVVYPDPFQLQVIRNACAKHKAHITTLVDTPQHGAFAIIRTQTPDLRTRRRIVRAIQVALLVSVTDITTPKGRR